MNWRIIELQSNTAAMNMAIDDAVARFVKQGSSKPTIRFYTWKPSAVSIGRFQSLEHEVNVKRCEGLGIDYVRRITGGGAVYHDSGGEITYSVIGPETMFPKGIRESYSCICQWVIKGLSNIGIWAEFAPINDILVEGKKISGNAQTRRNGILLQHGTVLYDLNIKKMFGVLKVSKAKISDKMIKNVEDRVTSVIRHRPVSSRELYNALLKGFTEGKEYEMGVISKEEMEFADELAENTYSSKEWNFSR
ncbi:MAG: lipoate--protein ligase family protein [Candidatus Micrarchaeota archaeon]|nr:lipoate--protein ligase family protein [Candidatus Micrarchaeota archaeon]